MFSACFTHFSQFSLVIASFVCKTFDISFFEYIIIFSYITHDLSLYTLYWLIFAVIGKLVDDFFAIINCNLLYDIQLSPSYIYNVYVLL